MSADVYGDDDSLGTGGREPELLEECWRAIGADSRIVACAIYRLHEPGFEVRLDCADNLQRIRHVASVSEGRRVAETWRRVENLPETMSE